MTAGTPTITSGSEEELLARDMIDVHGAQAATVARENARAAALAGQAVQAKSWLSVLGAIQRRHSGTALPPRAPGNPSPAMSQAKTAEG